MGANTKIFSVIAVFFFALSSIYTIWSLFVSSNPAGAVAPRVEWVGTVALGLCGMLGLLIAFYLGRIHASQGGELAEDRLDANIDDGDAEQGFFSPWSWWPIVLATSAALTFLGIAIGPWISFIGVAIFLISIVGWIFEYYRGYFAR